MATIHCERGGFTMVPNDTVDRGLTALRGVTTAAARAWVVELAILRRVGRTTAGAYIAGIAEGFTGRFLSKLLDMEVRAARKVLHRVLTSCGWTLVADGVVAMTPAAIKLWRNRKIQDLDQDLGHDLGQAPDNGLELNDLDDTQDLPKDLLQDLAQDPMIAANPTVAGADIVLKKVQKGTRERSSSSSSGFAAAAPDGPDGGEKTLRWVTGNGLATPANIQATSALPNPDLQAGDSVTQVCTSRAQEPGTPSPATLPSEAAPTEADGSAITPGPGRHLGFNEAMKELGRVDLIVTTLTPEQKQKGEKCQENPDWKHLFATKAMRYITEVNPDYYRDSSNPFSFNTMLKLNTVERYAKLFDAHQAKLEKLKTKRLREPKTPPSRPSPPDDRPTAPAPSGAPAIVELTPDQHSAWDYVRSVWRDDRISAKDQPSLVRALDYCGEGVLIALVDHYVGRMVDQFNEEGRSLMRGFTRWVNEDMETLALKFHNGTLGADPKPKCKNDRISVNKTRAEALAHPVPDDDPNLAATMFGRPSGPT